MLRLTLAALGLSLLVYGPGESNFRVGLVSCLFVVPLLLMFPPISASGHTPLCPRRRIFEKIEREGSVIETDKLRIKDFRAQGYTDNQISQMGLSASVEPAVGLAAPASKPLHLQQ